MGKELPGNFLDYTSHMLLQRCILASPGSCHKRSRALVGQPVPCSRGQEGICSETGESNKLLKGPLRTTANIEIHLRGLWFLGVLKFPKRSLFFTGPFGWLGCNPPGMGDLDPLFKWAFLQPFLFSTQLFSIEEAAADLCWNVLMSSM